MNTTAHSTLALPIQLHKQQIIDSVLANAVTIIQAETGAGKSTQVPQYLLRDGWEITVTQPRRIAATSLAERVAEEVGCPLGGLVGYATGESRSYGSDTKALFVTDGLALVRELMARKLSRQVLVLDEVHEWNINMEVLVAWAKLHATTADGGFRLVVMSATMESDKLSTFFNNAPVIEVPGRLFPVEERTALRAAEAARDLLSEGRNVLVFQPGKKEIADFCNLLSGWMGSRAVVLPLHGDMESKDQKAAFRRYDVPKCVVATNVAQTSVTIPDIDAVVDSGMERRVESVEGVETLLLAPISKADARQRKGRAGRTKAGVYVSCLDPCYKQLDFPRAEIERVSLDQTTLRLAVAGFDIETLPFFHAPDPASVKQAKKTLSLLGLIDRKGNPTPDGKKVARIPLDTRHAKMVLEGERLGVVDDVLTMAAIMDVGGITDKSAYLEGVPVSERANSDVLAQLYVYKQAKNWKYDEMRSKGVFVKAYQRAVEIRRKLAAALGVGAANVSPAPLTLAQRDALISCLLAVSLDRVYIHDSRSDYRHVDLTTGDRGERRMLAKESVCMDAHDAQMVIGTPFTIELPSGRHLPLITLATSVKVKAILEIAPHIARTEASDAVYEGGGRYAVRLFTYVAGETVSQDHHAVLEWGDSRPVTKTEHERNVGRTLGDQLVKGGHPTAARLERLYRLEGEVVRSLGRDYVKGMPTYIQVRDPREYVLEAVRAYGVTNENEADGEVAEAAFMDVPAQEVLDAYKGELEYLRANFASVRIGEDTYGVSQAALYVYNIDAVAETILNDESLVERITLPNGEKLGLRAYQDSAKFEELGTRLSNRYIANAVSAWMNEHSVQQAPDADVDSCLTGFPMALEVAPAWREGYEAPRVWLYPTVSGYLPPILAICATENEDHAVFYLRGYVANCEENTQRQVSYRESLKPKPKPKPTPVPAPVPAPTPEPTEPTQPRLSRREQAARKEQEELGSLLAETSGSLGHNPFAALLSGNVKKTRR